jgi:hypothetical protein
MQVGGVGFYPTSGSPFVHLDVGGVRAWPRMSREELVKIFPKGNTLHLPADGQPLPGYEQALADYKKRVGSDSIQIASTAGGAPASAKRRGFFATLFGGGGADEAEDNSESDAPVIASRSSGPTARPADSEDEAPAAAAPAAPVPAAPVMVAAAEPQQPQNITAPVPASRPAFRQDGPGALATALYSQQRNPAQEALALQAAAAETAQQKGENFADLSKYSVPVPTLLGSRGLKADADTSTMVASLGNAASPLQQMSAVPLPAHRPAAPQTVAMPAPAERPQELASANEQALTPELVAALSSSMDADDRKPAVAVASVRPVANTAQAAQLVPVAAPARKPMEVASLPKKVIQASAGSKQFGDVFDTPKWVAAAAAAVPTKGSRSTKPAMVPASGNLTKDSLERWALDNKRSGDVVSMKAPRVVTRTLSGEYSAAYASDGFRPVSDTAKIDPGRFSGN